MKRLQKREVLPSITSIRLPPCQNAFMEATTLALDSITIHIAHYLYRWVAEGLLSVRPHCREILVAVELHPDTISNSRMVSGLSIRDLRCRCPARSNSNRLNSLIDSSSSSSSSSCSNYSMHYCIVASLHRCQHTHRYVDINIYNVIEEKRTCNINSAVSWFGK